jgi:hypothetical protein
MVTININEYKKYAILNNRVYNNIIFIILIINYSLAYSINLN